MSVDNPEGQSPHDTTDSTEGPHTNTETPDWGAVGRDLATDRLEAAASDLRETFLKKAHGDDLDADDLRELFDELQAAAVTVGRIAEHTPGVENEAEPYRHLDKEETMRAIGRHEESAGE